MNNLEKDIVVVSLLCEEEERLQKEKIEQEKENVFIIYVVKEVKKVNLVLHF